MKRRLVLILSTIAAVGAVWLWAASLYQPVSFGDDRFEPSGRHIRLDCFDESVKITYVFPRRTLPASREQKGAKISAPGLLFRMYPGWDSGIVGPLVSQQRAAAVLQVSVCWLLILFGVYPAYRFIRSIARTDARGAFARRVSLATSMCLAGVMCLVLGHSQLLPAPRLLIGGEDGRLMIVRDFHAWCLLVRYGNSWRRSAEVSLGMRSAEFGLITPASPPLWKSRREVRQFIGFGMSATHLPRPPVMRCGTVDDREPTPDPRRWIRPAFQRKGMSGGALRRGFWAPAWFVSAALFLPPLAMIGKSLFKKWHRRRRGLCLECGYDLTGLPEPRCPECGTRGGVLTEQ